VSKSRSELAAVAVAIAIALLGGCDPGACVRESDCTGGYVCRTGRCALAADAGTDVGPADGGPVVVDAGHDASAARDAGTDASADADAN